MPFLFEESSFQGVERRGMHFRSGEMYSSAQRAILKKYGERTEVVGLTGFVFEGVAIS